jgi:uncharacterized protein YaiL (DUF2058 family)
MIKEREFISKMKKEEEKNSQLEYKANLDLIHMEEQERVEKEKQFKQLQKMNIIEQNGMITQVRQ